MSDLKSKLKKLSITSVPVILLTASNTVLAAEGSSEAVVTALEKVATDITSTIAAIAPVALGIAGTFLVWRYGMRFFKSISK